jgi:lipopolysaccharide heptosyltransferase III
VIHQDCRYYLASKPCIWNKEDGSECAACNHYAPTNDRILVIKLDALGDVVRTIGLLPAIRALHDRPRISFLTRPGPAAEIAAMATFVDEVIELTPDGMARILTIVWAQIYSLSNDIPSASVADLADGPVCGYQTDTFGHIKTSNPAAQHWLEIAAFDRLKRANRDTWQKHMLAIIGSNLAPEPALLRLPPEAMAWASGRLSGQYNGRKAAIYVGAGSRWPKKMLSPRIIMDLVGKLNAWHDIDVVLIRGPSEPVAIWPDAILADSPAHLAALISKVDLLICGDTLAMHLAAAMGTKTIALFGPTSIHEIETFGLIDKIAVPDLECLGCYGDCRKRDNCMSLIDLDGLVSRAVDRLMEQPVLAHSD